MKRHRRKRGHISKENMHEISVIEMNLPLSSIYFKHPTRSVKAENNRQVIFTILNELIIWLWGEVYKSKYTRDNWDKGFKKSFSVLRKDNKEYLHNNQINIWTEKSKNEMIWMSIRAQKAEWKRIVIGGKDRSERGKQTCAKRTMDWDQGAVKQRGWNQNL